MSFFNDLSGLFMSLWLVTVFMRLSTWPASVCQTVWQEFSHNQQQITAKTTDAISHQPCYQLNSDRKDKDNTAAWCLPCLLLSNEKFSGAWFIFSTQVIKAELMGIRFVSGFWMQTRVLSVRVEICKITSFTETQKHIDLSGYEHVCGLLYWFKNGIFIDELQVVSSSLEMTSSSVIPPRNRLDYTIDQG